jgi:predicted XRE-type DNA-binding protein
MPNSSHTISDKQLIAKALKKSIQLMGISKSDVAEILHVNQTQLSDSLNSGFDTNSQQWIISLEIIRIYRSLSALSSNNSEFMNHFLYTENKFFGNRPVNIMKTMEGLEQVHQFLDPDNFR